MVNKDVYIVFNGVDLLIVSQNIGHASNLAIADRLRVSAAHTIHRGYP